MWCAYGRRKSDALTALPLEGYYGLEVGREEGAALYASTDSDVYVSRNAGDALGDTWARASRGLPKRAHCGDISYVKQPNGERWLYMMLLWPLLLEGATMNPDPNDEPVVILGGPTPGEFASRAQNTTSGSAIAYESLSKPAAMVPTRSARLPAILVCCLSIAKARSAGAVFGPTVTSYLSRCVHHTMRF